MDVSRPEFASPLICIDGFLSDQAAQHILQECIDLEPLFVPATINEHDGGSKLDRSYRCNQVLYLNQLDRDPSVRADAMSILRRRIWSEDCKRLWHEGEYIFDIINYSSFQSGVISRYGDGDFYKRHRDTVWDHVANRLVTLVYYVNRVPERFSGGRLILFKGGREVALEPRHNRAILFPSFTVHEVEPVRMENADWADGRFSLNYWIGFH
jgi:Rps23 Pro-64 3,4-dihydroxylase Tpa1-like proline 4-hydroxylase